MRAKLVLNAVDSHTEGMPTRVVTAGVGELPGSTMAERRRYLIEERDDLRTLLMHEPRGHLAMSGSILQAPTRPECDFGVVFIEVSGCLPMCGHGTMGTATVLVETGMVDVTEPVTRLRLDTPAGVVDAAVDVVDGRAAGVTIRNVPSFLCLADAAVKVQHLGEVVLDLAFGGNFYALVPAASVGLEIHPSCHDRLIATGLTLMDAINEQLEFGHPTQPDIADCRHVVFTARGGDGASGRAAVAIHPGWLDRSPCGTGTSALMAARFARGELALGEEFVHESFIGSRFVGELVEQVSVGPYPAVVPTIRGRAWLTGMGTYLLDPEDPYPAGFLLGARQ